MSTENARGDAAEPTDEPSAFARLGLPANLLAALRDVGYEAPSPIQAATIPPLLAGGDVLGQAQTGTGKTAAFALPILAKLAPRGKPQALVLAPTRELAIQVAEAFQTYAAHSPGFHVLPIYGGQSYGPQLAGLKRGVHVVVGTPGRVIDHLDRGTLDLSQLRCLVLDEADEMLRMGFIDDVEKVLQKTPPSRQVALFSATMPAPIRRIAQKHLREPTEITIKNKTTTAPNIHQRYWSVGGLHKLDAMTRILEAEPFDAMLVFARTKRATEELAEKLQARGFAAAAINGDIAQVQRERTVAQLKSGKLDILVATDVAARGLDVDRISHVLNYDIPYDTESYVHRIGRTGRAGRKGEAILFVSPRERGMLRAIERATRQPIEPMRLPSVSDVNERRVERFMQRIEESLASDDGSLAAFRQLIERFEHEHDVPATDIAAALARMAQGDAPLLLSEPPPRPPRASASSERREPRPARDKASAPPPRSAAKPTDHRPAAGERAARPPRPPRPADAPAAAKPRADKGPRPRPARDEAGMQRYRIEVGAAHGVKPSNIVGAIANEAGLDSQYIGRVDIQDDHSLVDLPEGMPAEILRHLQKAWVSGQQLRIHLDGKPAPKAAAPRKPGSRPPRRGGGDAGNRPFKPGPRGKHGKKPHPH